MSFRLSEGSALHLGHELADLRVDVVERAAWAGEPELEIRVDGSFEIAPLEGSLFCRVEGLHLLGIVVVVGAGADEDERRDALGRVEREVERDHPTERRADNRRPFDTGGVERLGDGAAIVDGIRLDRRVPEARQVEANDGMRVRKGAELRLPHPRIGDARVDEHDGRAVAVDVVPGAHCSSANNGRTYWSNVSRSQLATVTGVSARTDAVRGMFIASATSPK